MSNLFTSQTPSIGNIFENQPVTVATTVVFTQDGTVSGGRFYAASSDPGGTYALVLYQATNQDTPDGSGAGSLLASKAYSSITSGAWNPISFDSPVSVTAGVRYKIGLRTSLGSYAATGAFFTTDLVNGDITGTASGVYYNGSFIESVSLYPNKTFNSNCYFVDVEYSSAAALPWTVYNGTSEDQVQAVSVWNGSTEVPMNDFEIA